MAALPNSKIEMKPSQNYYAEANVFSADIEQPIETTVDPQASVELPKTGGYDYKPAKPYNVEGLISYQSGYTQVAGHPSTKANVRGFTTLATSVIEGLNVLDVLTADRVVGQISTVHPYSAEGRVPSVTFLGTRFDNLRISGQKVDVEHNLSIIGPKPDGDKSYFEDTGVMSRLAHHFANINRVPDLPTWASQDYNWNPETAQRQGVLSCSLVSNIAGVSGGTTFGHVIDLPHFGRIYLGELKVTREKSPFTPEVTELEDYKYRFQLTMVRLNLGCLAHGKATFAMVDTNGQGSGGTTHKP